jgi:nitrite reductase (NADH) small subunit
MSFTKLSNVADLPPANEAKEFPCGQKTICIANVNGSYSAMDNICLHRGGPLGQGMVESGKVVCPWHGWAWDTKTGEAEQNPNMKIAVYQLQMQNEGVLIELPEAACLPTRLP